LSFKNIIKEWGFILKGDFMNLVFLGPPGAGKGTIAAIAKEFYDIPHISTGDLFRYNIKNDTELGKEVKAILASGDLVPDSVTIKMVEDRFTNDDAKKGFILDGFPRTIFQADALKEMIELDAVINFILDREEIIKRLSGRRMCKSTGKIYHIIYSPPKVEGIDDETGEALIQRDDDKEDAILNRLEVYAAQTEPLIDYYREKGLIVDIDASASSDVVFEQIKKALVK
jgi:adenylate kinase